MLGTCLPSSKMPFPLLLSIPSPFFNLDTTQHFLSHSHTSLEQGGQVWGYTKSSGIFRPKVDLKVSTLRTASM